MDRNGPALARQNIIFDKRCRFVTLTSRDMASVYEYCHIIMDLSEYREQLLQDGKYYEFTRECFFGDS